MAKRFLSKQEFESRLLSAGFSILRPQIDDGSPVIQIKEPKSKRWKDYQRGFDSQDHMEATLSAVIREHKNFVVL